MSFQESQLFEYERLNTPNPLPRLRVDIYGNLLTGFKNEVDMGADNPFSRWCFIE